MKWLDDRTAVAVAELRLRETRRKYRDDTQWLQGSVRQHRSVLIVGSGLAIGATVGWLPLRAFLRSGLTLLSMGAAVARTPLGPIVLGAMFAARGASDPADSASEPRGT